MFQMKSKQIPQQKSKTDELTCARCWWFRIHAQEKDKGHCLKYGFTMSVDHAICSDFDRGD